MLHLFPPGLEGTLLIPVLVGLLVMSATTEWWGWDFVGVVVPGYLCSVLLLQPVVAAVVLGEALLTWALVRGLDLAANKAGLTFAVFGRDRFFAFLVASVVVRVLLEGFALQAAAGVLQGTWPSIAAHRTELFGIGLVLVPLTANRFWRPGPAAGLLQLTVQTGVVWLVVGVGLARFTNFSLGGFELAYDQLALAFLSSPRTQIALLITAALASGFNRRYGWDFHGILVPALLTLATLTPLKLLSTVVEAAVIVVVARGLVGLPAFRNVNVEGSRKLVLCFLVGFAAKLALSALLAARYPGYRANDFFGLGYLLPSLLAERIWIKSNLPLVLVPTLQTAVVGAAQAVVLVAALAYLAPAPGAEVGAPAERYQSLSQAVAALGPVLRRGTSTDLAPLLAQARRGGALAETADGYRIITREAYAGLLALRAPGAPVLAAGLSGPEAEIAAAEAVRQGASLVLGGEPALAERAARELGAPLVHGAPGSVVMALPTAATVARKLLLEPGALSRPPVTLPPPRALAEAAFRLDRDRGEPERLATALVPLGVSLRRTADDRLVSEGPGWPRVSLAAGARAVVVAPHADEVDAAAAALFAAERLGADCVVPPAEPGGDPLALAVALAERRRRPLLIVRGRAEAPGAEALLLQEPEPPGRAPWLEPLLQVLEVRFSVSRDAGLEDAALRAFPPRAGRASAAALLWLSPRARHALAGAGAALARPDVLSLAARRGVPALHGDMARWLADGAGAPVAGAVEAAERLARTGDVAMLHPEAGGARLSLFVDEARGLVGVAVEARGRRAVALAGDRREARVAVARGEDAAAAIACGARTLTAEGGP